MAKVNKSIKTPIQNAFQYTLFISILYTIYKFFNIDTPNGTAFISYIIPMLLTNVILIAFPILFTYFYVRDDNTVDNIKESLFNKHDPQISELNNQTMLREYHGMLKEGIITQEEYDNIKKKYLKDLHKD